MSRYFGSSARSQDAAEGIRTAAEEGLEKVRRSMVEQMREFDPATHGMVSTQSPEKPDPADAVITCHHCRFEGCMAHALHCPSCGIRL